MYYQLPKYLYLMGFITFAYLTVEIPFFIHLVGVMGGNPSQEDIDAIEKVGRILTGLAVAIFVTGVFVFPKLHDRDYPLFTMIFAAITIGGGVTYATFIGLDKYAEATGEMSSNTQRQEAFKANMAKRHLAEHGVSDIKASANGEWNAFISVLPGLADADKLIELTGLPSEELAKAEARRVMGTPAEFRELMFGKPYDAVRFAVVDYQEASRNYAAHMERGAPAMAEDAWYEFRAQLESQAGNKRNYHASVQMHARDGLRRNGFTLPSSWNVNDKKGFMVFATKRFRDEYKIQYKEKMVEKVGAYIAPGLDTGEFLRTPLMQKNMREAFGLPKNGRAVAYNMSDKDFFAEVYGPKRKNLEAEFVTAVHANESEFGYFGDYKEYGINAVRATQLPVMAILLSIAGAVLHIFKFSGYVSQIVGFHMKSEFFHERRGRFSTAGAVTVAIFAVMLFSGNLVTSSKAYASFDQKGAFGTVLTGAIGIQPGITLLGNSLAVIGPWKLIAAKLPAPSMRQINVASDTVVEHVAEAAVEEAPISNIPVPLPRPKDL